MGRTRKYRPPEQTRRVTIGQIARETGMSRSKVTRWLARNAWWVGAKPQGFPPTYDARVIDLLNHLAGHAARPLDPPESDWLSTYLGGPTDATR